MDFPRVPTPPPPARRPPPTGAPLEARRGATGRLDSLTGRVHTVQGFFDLDGAGEALLDVNFPVWFMERPLFTFGAEMRAGNALSVGAYPTISVLVLRWSMKDYPGGVSYFAGATLVVVADGTADQSMLVHWRVEGKALRNPTGETFTADGAI